MVRNILGAVGLAVVLALGLVTPPASAQDVSADERKDLTAASKPVDPVTRAAALKKFIESHPKSDLLGIAHERLVAALIAAKAPTADVVAATEAGLANIEEGFPRADLYNTVAMELAERGEQLDRANDYATKAVASVPDDPDAAEMAAALTDTLGWVQYKRGEYDKAVVTFTQAVKYAADSDEILYHYGMALEKVGKTDEAIEVYIRAAAVFPKGSAQAETLLRALYEKRNGSVQGLDARIASARDVSRKRVVFEERRYEKQAPEWALKDIAGKPVKLSDFKGKVIVMDFWGSWCPPCRMELPSFQAMHDKYKGNKNVVFLGMNWEKPGEPAVRMKAVTDFMTNNKYTFPVVIDHDSVAVKAYELQGFPTVFMIDSSGMIRYRNVGYDDGVEKIIEAQLESLLK
jgi:thiol-disulfide isomerase/thioredoxin/Flp pilus assembly protein TadD